MEGRAHQQRELPLFSLPRPVNGLPVEPHLRQRVMLDRVGRVPVLDQLLDGVSPAPIVADFKACPTAPARALCTG